MLIENKGVNDEYEHNGRPEPASKNKNKEEDNEGFQKWTGIADEEEGKFKGWLYKGHKAFVQYTMTLKSSDVASSRYTLWERAFRKVTAIQQGAKVTKKTTYCNV